MNEGTFKEWQEDADALHEAILSICEERDIGPTRCAFMMGSIMAKIVAQSVEPQITGKAVLQTLHDALSMEKPQ
jgi:hypothetical protein